MHLYTSLMLGGYDTKPPTATAGKDAPAGWDGAVFLIP